MDRGNRIDNRARGNANQLFEKYKTLARDAQTQGDRVLNEYYLQFSDHYFRILNENRSRFDEQRRPRDDRFDRDDADSFDMDEDNEGEAGQSRPAFNDRGRSSGGESYRNGGTAPAEQREPEMVAPIGSAAPLTDEADDDQRPEQPRRRRAPRSERGAASEPIERMEADRLPPALSVANDSDDVPVDEAPKPKRRGRPPKSASALP